MKIYIKLLAVASVLFFSSCQDWLDIQQEGEIESGKLFAKGEGYRVVLNGVYKSMGAATLYGGELSYGMVDAMSQQYDLNNREANSAADMPLEDFQDFKYTNTTTLGVTESVWQAGFKVIANTNDLIQNIDKTSADIFEFGEMERKLIFGEAYACRALMHFDLLRLFAPALVNDDQQTYVPYVETYPNIYATSMQTVPFLDKVIADLLKAKELVAEYDTSSVGVKASQTVSARMGLRPSLQSAEYSDFFYGRVYRLNYYSITALLARVYQYAGKHKEAFDCAKEVSEFGLHRGENKVFYTDDAGNFNGVLSKTGEDVVTFDGRSDYKVKANVIFSAYNKLAYDNLELKNRFKNIQGGTQNAYCMVKRIELFNSRGVDEWELDVRSTNMIYVALGLFSVSGKWFIPTTKPDESEHLKMSPVIRFTEMLYIMAECYAREGNYGGAYQILNDIRTNRKLARNLTTQNSFTEFVTDLIDDARREWISEGQLFYLYKRLDAPFIKNKEQRKLTKAEASLPLPADQK